MSETDYGEIRPECYSTFVWEIPDFISVIKRKKYDLRRPDFEFAGDIWNLFVYKELDDSVTYFYLSCDSSDTDCPSTQLYKLEIKDSKGRNYWTTPLLLHVFYDLYGPETYQGLFESELNNNEKRIFPEGVFSLHLTFFQGRQPLSEDDDSDEDENYTSSRTNVRSETGRNLLGNQDSNGIHKLLQNFKDLLLKEEDCDVTLNVRDRKFRAHRPILKARSPVFATMFRQEMLEKKSNVVEIDDCDPDAFGDFLLYLYTGKLEKLDRNSVIPLHYIGQKYDVGDMAETCVEFMIDNLTVDSFCEFIAVGLRHCEMDLIESANMFFADNMKKIVATQKWRLFFLENSTEAHELLNKALDRILI